MALESLKKAVLDEVKHDYALYSSIENLFEVANQAEAEERERIEQESQEQEQKKTPSIAEFARKSRLVK